MTKLAAVTFSAALVISHVAFAQSPSTSTKIEAYDGPPIYLDSPPDPVPATRVTHKVSQHKYDNDQVWIEQGIILMSDDTFASHGVYREFYRDGQQFVDGQYAEGKPAGEWTYWHPNGQLAKKVTYRDGKPDGVVEVFREDGTLKERKSYSAGARDGQWQNFYKDGETTSGEGTYAAGKEDGVWKSWYENGQLHTEISFQDGKMNGVASEWFKDGSPKASINFRDGKRHGMATQWSSDGEKVEINYEEGRPATK